MQRKRAPYEFPVPGHAWTRGAGDPAGVYFLEGRCHLAALSSPAERDLVERGALRMAVLRFDAAPLPGPAARTVRPLAIDAAVRRYVRVEEN